MAWGVSVEEAGNAVETRFETIAGENDSQQ
jgi:hypothetical protein